MAHGTDDGIFSGRSSLPRGTRGRLTRRDALRLAGLSGLGMALLTACGQQAPAAKPAEAPKPAESKPAAPAPTTAPAAPAAQQAPAQKPAEAAKPAADAKPAAAAGPAPKMGGVFSYYYSTEDPPTLDPFLNVSYRSQIFAAFFYSRLLMSKKGPGIPAQAYIMEGDLAETWKVSPDAKTYTFNLRPDAKWQNVAPMNGRPVTAADVAWSFERFMKVSPQKTTFDIVDSVSAPNEKTVEFKLKDGYAPFEAAVGAPVFWIMPKEVIEADGDATKRVIGSGPFIFDKHDKGISFNGKKNKEYYRKGEPRVDEVVGLIMPDVATRMAGLRGKELDAAVVESQDVETLKKSNPDLQFVERETLNIPFLYWHLDEPPWNDPRVRQAFSMGINREERIQVIHAGRGNWNNAVPWALSDWWLDPRGPDMGPNGKFLNYDPAEAKKLLAAAGFPDGMKVDMIATPGYGQVWVQAVELMQQSLKTIGVDATIKMQEYAAYIGTTFKGQFPGGMTMVYGLETPFTEPHDFLFNMYHPKGTRNHAGVNDAKLTEMIDKQARTVDRAERKKQIFEIQRYLAEQSYYPPVTAGIESYGVQPYVRDFFPLSDYGIGAEVIPKLWLDK